MRIEHPTMVDLLRLCADARPDERVQYKALTGLDWNVDEVATSHYAKAGLKFALVDDDGIAVSAAGLQPVIPGVWVAWMLGTTANWDSHWWSITRTTRRIMDRVMKDGARRIEIEACADRPVLCDWYTRALGMELEGVKKGFGLNGEDMALFARVRG